MNGYFGALMRSSGMAFAGRPPVVAHAGPIVAEADVERSLAATPLRAAETASTAHQTVAPVPVADSGEQRAAPKRPTSQTADADARGPRAAFAGPDDVRPHGAVNTASVMPAVPTTSAPRSAEGPTPDLGQELVRAAMQWVAADPHARAAVQSPSRGPSLPSRDEGVSVIGSEMALSRSLGNRGIDVDLEPPSAPPPMAAPPDRTTHESFSPPALPIRPFVRTVAVSPVPAASPSRDEIVEVSIGAIHVRVDAPAAQTVARPAPTAPAAGPRAASAQSTRSGLSRRALRRI